MTSSSRPFLPGAPGGVPTQLETGGSQRKPRQRCGAGRTDGAPGGQRPALGVSVLLRQARQVMKAKFGWSVPAGCFVARTRRESPSTGFLAEARQPAERGTNVALST